MDPDDVRALTDYLTKGVYPLGLNRDDKRSLRQKANSFLFSDGQLYHRGKEGRKQLVICNVEEKLRIIHAMHTEPGSRGGHNGMNTTIRKISEQYWWRRLVEDVRAFCKSCSVCSHLTMANQRPVYVAPVEWPEEFASFAEPVYVSAPVVTAEYTDMTSSSYATDLLRMLSSLYDQKVCCDVVLSAGRFQTQAHKVVLIASSGFFKSLLLDKDLPFNDVITLSSVSGPCLESLVSYLYTGILRLNRDNVDQTLEAANYLDITSAVELCQRYIRNGGDGTWHDDLVPEVAPDQTLKLADEKSIVKNDEEFAELELFIESHLAENRHLSELTTSIKEEDDSGVVEKRVHVKKESATSSPESQKRLEQRVKECSVSSDTRKRKNTGEESASLGFDNSPQQKKSRGRPRKAFEVVEQTPERRYATRSSTGVVVGRRSGADVEEQVSSPPESQVKIKPLLVQPEDCVKKQSPAVLSGPVLRNLLFTTGDQYKCAVCFAGFKLSTGLKLHYSVAHGFVLARVAGWWLSRKIVDRVVRARFTGICLDAVASNDHGTDGDKTTYSCATCHASFALKSEAMVHRMQTHSTSYTCRVSRCFRQFRTCLKLLCHQRFKHGCGTRNKTTAPVVSAKQSPIAKTSVAARTLADTFVPEDVFSISNKCGWCGQTFASREQLLEHRQTVHRKPKLPESVVTKRRVQRDWSCKEKGCGVTFKTKDKLKTHMSETHPSVVFSCPECRFKTQVEQILLRHLVRRHRERHMCQLCGKAYHKPFLLRVHLFNRHKLSDPQLKLYHCQHEGCDYACPSKNGLNLHVLKHTSGSPFACNLCSKTFKRSVGLEKHISKIHLGIRPYICDKCGVSYGDESELKIHMTRHAENKPYACSYCDYSTFQKGNLKSHLFCRHQVLMDQEMLVMKCDQCSFTTDKKCRFHDHVKMHRNIRDIPCAECGKMFVTKKTLRQHIIKVHRQKNFTCPHCSYSTAVQSKLQEHVRSLHANQDPNAAGGGVAFIDSSQLQLQSPHHIQMQNCVNGIVPSSLAVMHDYQTLMPLESGIDAQQQLGIAADGGATSSIVVRIPMSLDSGTYCFQTLDRSHLVI